MYIDTHTEQNMQITGIITSIKYCAVHTGWAKKPDCKKRVLFWPNLYVM